MRFGGDGGGGVVGLGVVFMMYVSVCFAFPECNDATGRRIGHGEAFGCHREADEGLAEYVDVNTLSMVEFAKEHVLPRRPAVLRGAAKAWPALQRWNDEYLTEKYGMLEVKLEGKREKSGTARLSGSELLAGRGYLGSFVNHSDTSPDATMLRDSSYVVTQLPSPMAGEVGLPSLFHQNLFSKKLLEANLWLSSGDTRSMLHRDADNVVNCVVHGRKEWILVHPVYAKYLPMAVEKEEEVGGFALMNPSAVDLETYPNISKVHYYHTTVHAGDCLYLPWGYLHQVTSPPGRNIAISFLFALLHEPIRNTLPPPNVPSSFIPLSSTPPLWDYPGHGAMSMGNADPEFVRQKLSAWFMDPPKSSLPPIPLRSLLQPTTIPTSFPFTTPYTPLIHALKEARRILSTSSSFTSKDALAVWRDWTNVGFARIRPHPQASRACSRLQSLYVTEIHGQIDDGEGELSGVGMDAEARQEMGEFCSKADLDGDRILTLEELDAAPASLLTTHLLLLFHFDPGNTETWEYHAFDATDVRTILQLAFHNKPTSPHVNFRPDLFKDAYTTTLGGSVAAANSIIAAVHRSIESLPQHTPSDHSFPSAQLPLILDQAVSRFKQSTIESDPALDHLEESLSEDL